MKKIIFTSLALSLLFLSCKEDKKVITDDNKTVNTSTTKITDSPATEKPTTTNDTKFSWDNITTSTEDIGDYPYIAPPKTMKINKSNSGTQSYEFHKLQMFDGTTLFDLEGRVDKMSIQMDPNSKQWNQYLFDKSIEEYLKSIGAVLVSDEKIPNELIKTWGTSPNEQYAHMNKFYVGDVVNDKVRMYVLKTADKKIGFQIYSDTSTGNIGVVELENFKQTIEKVTAKDILNDIETKGFASLYINFDTGKSRIKTESFEIIDEITKMMKDNKDLKISIEGHTDNVGDEKSNLKLSENRAKSVQISLIDEGIDANRLKSKGFGQTKPIEDNTTEQGRAKNRRVELRKI